ncbi:hypothetical protein [Piscinibacter terrae]|uniref:Uncharacterized protein n=1 Tax=Piscinibacter terrae TaxID=2496871 RepID=A0A3N7HKV9_9BURK|nr:hypothetical protein [Albitalea terrae]RQP22724.1 hypothetical protein DZC73_20715 [Albitalea terrae]
MTLSKQITHRPADAGTVNVTTRQPNTDDPQIESSRDGSRRKNTTDLDTQHRPTPHGPQRMRPRAQHTALQRTDATPSGADSQAVVLRPPREMAMLSQRTRMAYQTLSQLSQNLVRDGIDPYADGAPADRADPYFAALQNYVTEASGEIRALTTKPQSLEDPTVQRYFANVLGQFAGNTATFTIPTVVAAALEHVLGDKAAMAVYAGSIGLMAGVGGDLQPAVTRLAGGVAANLFASTGNHGLTGLYKAIAGQLGITLGSVMIHGLTHMSLTAMSPEFFGGTVAGRGVRAGIAGGVMSIGTQAALMGAAHLTLRRNGVNRAQELPEMDHTRSAKGGVFLNGLSAVSERTTATHKMKEVAARTVSALVGAVALYGLTLAASDAAKNGHISRVGQSAASILGAYTVFFGILSAIQALGTLMMFDPKRHIARFGKMGGEHLGQQLADCAMTNTQRLLDRGAVAMSKGAMGEDLQRFVNGAASVLNGEAFRTGRLEDATELAMHIHGLAAAVREDAQSLANHDLTDTTLHALADKLHVSATSIEIAVQNHDPAKGGVLYPELSDALNRLRQDKALLLKGMCQLGGHDQLGTDTRFMQQAERLVTLFNAVSLVEQQAKASDVVSRFMKFTQNSADAAATAKAVGVLSRPGMVDQVLQHVQRSGQDAVVLRNAVQRLSQAQFGDAATAPQKGGLAAKLALLENGLNRQINDGHRTRDVENQQLDQLVLDFASGDTATRDRAWGRFALAFRNGDFAASQLYRRVLRHLDDPSLDLPHTPESGRLLPWHDALKAFRDKLDAPLLQSMRDEIEPPSDDVHGLAESMMQGLWDDLQKMPEAQRNMIGGMLSLPSERPVPGVPVHAQKDIHAHLTNYNGIVTDIARQVLFNHANRVEEMTNAAIPHQIPNSTAEKKYYTTVERLMDYMNRDYMLGMQWLKMNTQQQHRVLQLFADAREDEGFTARIDVSSTGVDPTDKNSAKRELALLERAFQDTGLEFKVMGETTLRKEQVRKLTPREIKVDGEASEETLREAMIAGKAILLHADNGDSHLSKRGNSQRLDVVFQKMADFVTNWPGADPIRGKAGNEAAAAARMLLCYAHAAGLARFMSDKPDHVRLIDRMLRDPRMNNDQALIVLDVAWDFVSHFALQNVYDNLKKANLAPAISQALQNILKSYRAFEVIGGTADKADDLGDLDQAQLRATAGNDVTDLHMQTLASFRHTVKRSFETPAVRTAFANMARHMGAEGNNWLYLFAQHPGRLAYGSDTLAPGIKAHGADAFALNSRNYEFVYVIFDELAKHWPDEFGDITQQLSRGTYDRITNDAGLEARRQAYERDVREGGGQWGSTPARPERMFAEGLLDRERT